MRALIAGGGTGGHINPAIAIASIIKRYEPDSEIAFVGTPNGMENRLIPKAGFELYHVDITGFTARSVSGGLKYLRQMSSSAKEAGKIIREFRPDVCIGTGGYVSWPLIRAAQKLKIPTAMHESNALAGKAVKALAPGLDVLFVNFAETAKQVRCGNVVHSGNPLRADFGKITRDGARKKLGLDQYRYSILSCGGSLGAEPINVSAIGVMNSFGRFRDDVHHLHQAGAGKIGEAKRMFDSLGLGNCPNLCLTDYIYDMPERLAAADIVIGRAGAMTVSELAFLGRAAILIPSPYVADNHQYRNARALADLGACILIEEKHLSPEVLKSAVSGLISDETKLREMSESIRRFAVENTDEIIFNGIKSIIR
ncbi:MAG: UDP-N-acetylglucosamine--N-acetylmuramyl-(pentapeptide) pyrophosphoryl-undecaprenol N-acetylglucosamine transferase [Clostridia bacterium]|nr:UDP-N-acetylglucosamine--N-acetylmuramyl-(pentapeptide) pyrophosphoryl-undecaprenol N-acetylglucosamine transferase [Clostridia bacterium]